MFDTPLAMDDVLIPDRRARNVMQRGITPIVVSAIFRALWSNSMGVVMASAIAQQGLTAHKENKTDETGREVEVAGVEGEEEKEDEGNKEGNGDLDGHMNSYVDMNSYEVEENGDVYRHVNSYVDMNAYMSVEVDPSERDIVWRSGWRSRPQLNG